MPSPSSVVLTCTLAVLFVRLAVVLALVVT